METPNKDRRMKREIANSNERRRMQSINAGFHKLKSLLPVNDGEKISKANILQHAADFITTIERDRLMLHEQNTLLRQLIKDLKFRSENKAVLENVNLDVLPTIPLNPRVAVTSSTTNVTLGRHRGTKGCTDDAHNDERIMSTNNRNNGNTVGCIDGGTTKGYQRQRKMSQNRTTRSPSKHTKNTSNTDSDIGSKTTSSITSVANDTDNQAKIDCNISINSNRNDKSIYEEILSQPVGSVAEIISDKVSSQNKNGLAAPGSVAKAAIALPLEVPYTTETIIGPSLHHDGGSNTAQGSRRIIKNESMVQIPNMDPQDSAPKGQNLDTICKAIMEIEGDRVFRDENMHGT